MGTPNFQGSAPKKIGATKVKFGTNDYVGKEAHMRKLVTLSLLGPTPHTREI